MEIHIPKDVGGELKVLPEGTCRATVEGLSVGKTREGKPKATVRYVVLTELYPSGAGATSIGERVLETFSLQSQALWNINGLYKEATGENIPQGDYDDHQFQEILEAGLKGTEWSLVLATELTPDGGEQTRVQRREFAK